MTATKPQPGYIRISLAVIVVLGVAVGGTLYLTGKAQPANATEASSHSEAGHGAAHTSQIPVKTVQPLVDKNFQMTVDRPADVRAYYRADVEARVPGVVRKIRKTIGSLVKEGEEVVAIDVPDLDAQAREKCAVVEQRKRELNVSEARVHQSEKAVETARANVAEKKAMLGQAEAHRRLRQKQRDRLQRLRESNSVDQDVVDEAVRHYEVAQSEIVSANAALVKAQAEVEDAAAALDAAKADQRLKAELIEVAQADYEQSLALQGYAHVKAPFDGTVVRRKVDPGSFVQNASTGHPTPLLTVERTDIVTVVMRVPDAYAPYVNSGTQAIIELDALPGLKIHGKVTRFAPSLVNEEHDRTMKVEVDLWNGTAEAFHQFVAAEKAKKTPFEELKEGPLPLLPELTGRQSEGRSARLLPGMYGKMTLVLHTFGNSYLLPSSGVVSVGGRPFIWVARDGKAVRLPVDVQVDDGKLAKVELVGKDGSVTGDLTGNEEVIVSNQGELSEGQAVSPARVENWHKVGLGAKAAH